MEEEEEVAVGRTLAVEEEAAVGRTLAVEAAPALQEVGSP
jgi:hypothetical protein